MNADSSKPEQAFSGYPGNLLFSNRLPILSLSRLHRARRIQLFAMKSIALAARLWSKHANPLEQTALRLKVKYTATCLRIPVRDERREIDPEVVRSGREGHWGFKGVREGESVGARLRALRRSVAGTEWNSSFRAMLPSQNPSKSAWMNWMQKLYQPRTQPRNIKNGQDQ